MYVLWLLLCFSHVPTHGIEAELQVLQQQLNLLKDIITPVPAASARIAKEVIPSNLHQEHQDFMQYVIKKVPVIGGGPVIDGVKLNDMAEDIANKMVDAWDTSKGLMVSSNMDHVVIPAILAEMKPVISVEEFKNIWGTLPKYYGSYRKLIEDFRGSFTSLKEGISKVLGAKLNVLYKAENDVKELDERIAKNMPSAKSEEDLIKAVITCMSPEDFEKAKENDFTFFIESYDKRKSIFSARVSKLLRAMSEKITAAWKKKENELQAESKKGLTGARRDSIKEIIRKINGDIFAALGAKKRGDGFFAENPTGYGGYTTESAVYKSVLESIDPRLPEELESEFMKDNPVFNIAKFKLSESDVDWLVQLHGAIKKLIPAIKDEMDRLGVTGKLAKTP